jgi:zinc transport system substrate-binding protein
MKVKMLFLLVVVMSVVVACSSTPEMTREETAPIVFVSIVPQQYFINRIAGDLVDARVMVEPGADAHTYEPKPSQMAALSDAFAYFAVGIEFEEAWLVRFADANPDMLIIDTTDGIEKMPMAFEHSHEGEEDHEEDVDHDEDDDEHQDDELDPHVWVSPALVKMQVELMYDTLVELLPEHEAAFSDNLATFLDEIDALEADIELALADVTSRKFIVFHPAWGYFAEQFDLVMIPIEVGGTEPSAAELSMVIDEAKEEDIRVIFAQPEFSTKSAETIASEIDGEVILISPLAYNWLENLQQVAQVMAEVLNQ